MTTKRPTPMTDKMVANDQLADDITDYRNLRDFARRLERVAGELAARLKPHVCSCDICTADRAALAEWNTMKEELT